jgi:autotransporter-associated beta strand protein
LGGINGSDTLAVEFRAGGGGALIEGVVYNNATSTLTFGAAEGTTSVSSANFTKFGTGTTTFNGSTNSLGANIAVNQGTLQFNSTGWGSSNITLNPGTTLNLRANSNTTFASAGTITVNAAEATAATINVGNLTSGLDLDLAISNLTVSDSARLNVSASSAGVPQAANLMINGATVLGNFSSISAENVAGQVRFNGSYSDTYTSVLRNNNTADNGSSNSGFQFMMGGSVDVKSIIRGTRAIIRAGNNTTVNYDGYIFGENTTTWLLADEGSRLVFGANATLDNSLGWSGTTYGQNSQVSIGGIVEFSNGFQGEKVYGSLDRTDVNFGGELMLRGQMVTNNSTNFGRMLYVTSDAPDVTWTSNTNAQVFNVPTFIRAAFGIVNNSDMTLNGPVFIGTNAVGDAAAINRDWVLSGNLNLGQSAFQEANGAIVKSGAEDLTLNGPLSFRPRASSAPPRAP